MPSRPSCGPTNASRAGTPASTRRRFARPAMEAVTRPLNLVFESYGLDRPAAVHWYRIVFASVHGFAVLRRDGLITLPGDPDESLRHMIQAFVHQIEVEAGR